MLELSEWKLKITVIHMPRALVEKSGQQVKTDGKINVSRDVNPKNRQEMPEINNTEREMKTPLTGSSED